jgi:NDP-sugar pyrophosphorylase family protein
MLPPIAILAGGLATRLRPVTETIPKALIRSGRRAFPGAINCACCAGPDSSASCCWQGYLGEQIQAFAGDGRDFGLQVEYVFDGPSLLGTAGALRRALPVLGDEFAVIYGDSYLRCDYAAAIAAFRDSGKLGLMTVYRNEGLWDSSNVEFASGRILAYDKANRTPTMQHIDYGLGAFRGGAFDGVPEGVPYDLATGVPAFVGARELAAWESPERFYEIGSVEGIADLERFLRG